MEKMLMKANVGEQIDSKDHRVVQAIVMWGLVYDKAVKTLDHDVVKKTWPQFWNFLEYAKSLKEGTRLKRKVLD